MSISDEGLIQACQTIKGLRAEIEHLSAHEQMLADHNKVLIDNCERLEAERDTLRTFAQPLTEDEIYKLYQDETGFLMHTGHSSDIALMDFARAIEKAHNIGSNNETTNNPVV